MASPDIGDTRSRRLLNGGILAVFVLFIIFWQAGNFAASRHDLSFLLQNTRALFTFSRHTQDADHPIPKLMVDAEDKFRLFLTGQSKTLEEAVEQYKKRYKRDPPRGFDEWFGFTATNEVKVIDDYDAIFEDLEPFWALSGAELRSRVDQVCVHHALLICRTDHPA